MKVVRVDDLIFAELKDGRLELGFDTITISISAACCNAVLSAMAQLGEE